MLPRNNIKNKPIDANDSDTEATVSKTPNALGAAINSLNYKLPQQTKKPRYIVKD